jgi:hypothetical protein
MDMFVGETVHRLSGFFVKSPCQGSSIIAHERLAIVDPDSGDQPLFNEALEVGMEPRGMLDFPRDLSAQIPYKCFACIKFWAWFL